MDYIEFSASELLKNLGWSFLSSEQIYIERGNKINEVMLPDLLRQALRKRRYMHNGVERHFSESSIESAITRLGSSAFNQGISVANEKIYNYLIYGISVREFFDGKKINATLPIIDWFNVKNNHFVFTTGMTVAKIAGGETERLGIVCFVNGLPFVVIESQAHDSPKHSISSMNEGIAQHIRNQHSDRFPNLFIYAQILLAINGEEGRYGTQGSIADFWVPWYEKDISEEEFYAIKRNVALDIETSDILLSGQEKQIVDVRVSGQDRLLISLLSHHRLLEIIRFFIVFDKKKGKLIARHQQFFAVKRLLRHIGSQVNGTPWEGGVIWHTSGSGKSLTMFFLAKTLILYEALKQYKVIIVTDRVDLEAQLSKTFRMSGEFPGNQASRLAKSGKHLAAQIARSNKRIIFSIINKFATASKIAECVNNSSEIIVLVDEGHRSQGGKNYQLMRRALPNATFVAFTGTPLLKDDKTINKFGPIVHAYTMQKAVEDKAVTPLLYEERLPQLGLDERSVDMWFKRITVGLRDEQKIALKKRCTRKKPTYRSEDRIQLIAYDIANHFFKNIDEDLKGQLACDSKIAAIKYKQFMDELGLFESAIIMSAPNVKKGNCDLNATDIAEVKRWWKENIGTQNESLYTKDTVHRYKHYEEPRMLIVVDKLLTGFDAPKNTVLYIDKPLKGHNLMQAVARINRLHPKKEFGLLIDYRGILAELDTTIDKYQDLANRTQGGFDINDIKGLYHEMSIEYKRLPHLYRQLRNMFKEVNDQNDIEQLRQVLTPRLQQQDGRIINVNSQLFEDFEDNLREFINCLKIALQSANFYQDDILSNADLEEYQTAAKQFSKLIQLLRVDLNQVGDNGEYAFGTKGFVDESIERSVIKAPKIIYKLGENGDDVGIQQWSEDKICNELSVIKNRVTYIVEQDLRNDPYAQQVFSTLLKQTIKKAETFYNHPLKQYELFSAFNEQVKKKAIDGFPERLSSTKYARVCYGILLMHLGKDVSDLDQSISERWVEIALKTDAIITNALVEYSLDVNNMKSHIRKNLLPIFFYEGKKSNFQLEDVKAIINKILSALAP